MVEDRRHDLPDLLPWQRRRCRLRLRHAVVMYRGGVGITSGAGFRCFCIALMQRRFRKVPLRHNGHFLCHIKRILQKGRRVTQDLSGNGDVRLFLRQRPHAMSRNGYGRVYSGNIPAHICSLPPFATTLRALKTI